MKFRNKKTGEEFGFLISTLGEYCCDKPCGTDDCPLYKLSKGNCIYAIRNAPISSAEIMGYDVIYEDGDSPVVPVGLVWMPEEEADAKADTGKPRPTLVPVSLMEAVTAVREYGCAKYHDPENWRRVEPQRYRDALYRHWLAYLKGEKKDQESGLPHLWHLACNVAFLIEMEQEDNGDG